MHGRHAYGGTAQVSYAPWTFACPIPSSRAIVYHIFHTYLNLKGEIQMPLGPILGHCLQLPDFSKHPVETLPKSSEL